MAKAVEIPLGTRFGKLVTISVKDRSTKKARVLCQCDCGNTSKPEAANLVSGTTKSCGCLHKAMKAYGFKTTHGQSKGLGTAEYRSWMHMNSRCFNPQVPEYVRYGGRGITVCDRWRDSFENFLSDVGKKPSPKHSLDRINNEGNYEPGNVRWATPKEQALNRRSNRWVTWDGETMTITQWAEFFGMSFQTLFCRLNKGWSFEKAVTTPLRGGKPNIVWVAS